MRYAKIIVVFIVLVILTAIFYIFKNSNPEKEPPNLRITIVGDKMFIRWSSNKSTLGEIEIGGKKYEEKQEKMLHKLLIPYMNKGHIRIVEMMDGKEYTSYRLDLNRIKNTSISVGIYAGYGADAGSYRMLSSLFVDIGFDVEFLIPKDFKNLQRLFKYDFIVFPGGRADHMISKLSRNEIYTIRNYVAMGGSYMGVCAGSYFASNSTVWHGVEYGDETG